MTELAEKNAEKNNETGEVVKTGGKDRFWHMRAWTGMTFSGWFRVLWHNRFAVSITCIPMVLVLTPVSLFNSALALIQKLTHGRRVTRVQLPDDPIFVLGHWRSGTTLLHELLVCDPQHTYPDTYACFGPNHFLLTSWLLRRFLGFLIPPTRPMDNMAIRWDYPQEDEWAMCNMGLKSPYLTLLFPNHRPQYPEYVDMRNVAPADREKWKRKLYWFLQCLTYRNPKRVVLKTPLHTCRIKTLLEIFPRARFVHISRDPYVLFPSMIHTWKRLYKYQGAQNPRYDGLEEHVLAMFTHMYEVFEEDIKLLDPSKFCEVRYDDLVTDPIGQMERIYTHLGLEGFEQVRPALSEHAKRTRGYQTNRYTISEQNRNEIARRWAPYIEKYGPWEAPR